eukprot:1647479-Pleurochrysis_carterae.AAC.1
MPRRTRSWRPRSATCCLRTTHDHGPSKWAARSVCAIPLATLPKHCASWTLRSYGRGATSRCASARCVLRGF